MLRETVYAGRGFWCKASYIESGLRISPEPHWKSFANPKNRFKNCGFSENSLEKVLPCVIISVGGKADAINMIWRIIL